MGGGWELPPVLVYLIRVKLEKNYGSVRYEINIRIAFLLFVSFDKCDMFQ